MNTVNQLITRATRPFNSAMKEVKMYGVWATLKKAYFLREAWWEKGNKRLVGQDKYGNKYWETTDKTEINRDRWVELHGKRNRIWDASDIPAAWHMWLHRIRDMPPSDEEQEGHGRATRNLHIPNRSGEASDQYYPPGHFFNPKHRNQDNVGKVSAFDPNHQMEVEGEEKKEIRTAA